MFHCTIGLDGIFLTDCSRALFFSSPQCVLTTVLLALDVIYFLGITRLAFVHQSIEFASRPFRNFLQLEDLAEFEEIKQAKDLKTRWKLGHVILALVCQILLALGTLVIHTTIWPHPILTITATANLIALVYMLIQFSSTRPRSTPYALTLFSLLNCVAALVDTYHYVLPYSPSTNSTLAWMSGCSFALSFSVLVICTSYPMNSILPSPRVSPIGARPSNAFSSPEDAVTLGQWMTFSYIDPILRRSGEGTLNEEDVWDLPPGFKHANLFQKYLRVTSANSQKSLVWFLITSNSQDLIIDIGLKLWTSVIGFVPPYCLSRILSSLENHQDGAHTDAYFFAFLAFLAHMSFAQLDLLQGWHSRRAYERTRGQLFCALHWKALRSKDVKGKVVLKSNAPKNGEESKDEESNVETGGIGRITNLMSGDSYAVAQRFWEFSAVFTAPVKLTIALVFLYRVLGWSSFVGVAIVLLAYLVTWPLARWSIKITRSSWAAKDTRMSLVNELIQSVRFLKYMGWESHWTDKVKNARNTELSWRVKENVLSSIIAFIWTWIPSAVVLAAFSSYTVLGGHPLTVSKAFVSIEIFSQLQGPMADLPNQIFALLHAYVSMQRIQTYLEEDEVEDWASSLKGDQSESSRESCVGFSEATFKWYSSKGTEDTLSYQESTVTFTDTDAIASKPSSFLLGELNIKFPLGKLSLVTGATGSGKSSLLWALLGEMDCVKGSVHLNKKDHSVAYAGQFPFLEHATIRENILYHTPYDAERYEAVLSACALRPDIAILDVGDATEIGEKGVSLSGGQRARIALARAIYSQSKVVLLDDPLAAVDMHTAHHLFESCLSPLAPLISGRTVILVTHHVSLCLPGTSYLVELDRGKVLHQGSVEDLRRQGVLARVIDVEDVLELPQASEPPQVATLLINDADEDTFEDLNDPATAEPPSTLGRLVDAESRAEGRVSIRTYLLYVKAAGWISWMMTFVLLIAIRAVSVGNQLFVARWAGAYRSSTAALRVLRTVEHSLVQNLRLPSPADDVIPWLMIYLAISLGGAFATLAYIIVGYVAGLRASRQLFVAMLDRVVRAPTRFFDKTPTGRILNRFVADIAALDNALNSSARTALAGTLTFFISFGVIVYVVPNFALFATFIAFLYIRIAPPFVRTARDLRRLESISLSPAFSGFDELLHGLVTIRAFAQEHVYQNRFYTRVDTFQTMDHVYWLAQMWLRWRYDVLGSVVVFLTTLFALYSGVSEGLAAIVIVQSGIFAEASRQLVRVLAQAELDFNSIERIKEYLEVDQEAPARLPNAPPAFWPSSSGGIDIKDLVVRYSPDLPPVLKGISFSIMPREKVGVVGRTGSGKSTLGLSLLRIVEPTGGCIILDGIDTSTVGLDDIRENITIVSQDVSLFSGSIRTNLDPLNQHSDAECWDVLERCHLVHTNVSAAGISERSGSVTSLAMPVSAGGSSFSAGQRQLLALARAMLRQSLFIILDEASSSIDLATDDQIQKTIREEMANSLVITIAHRLKTILDYDRILVLGDGNVLEYDTPKELFAKKDSVFRGMCERSADWEELKAIVLNS